MTGSFALPVDPESARNDDRQWIGRNFVKGPTWLRMPILTVGMLGLQIVWSVEMGYASPYLLSLGLSKSLMSTVFVAGPLSGLIMQPFIGVLADRSTSRFGRRRPFYLAGSIICAFALLLLGFTKSVASIFGPRSTLHDTLTIGLAVFAIYLIDFSINAAMATDRALLVDSLSTSEQETGNAWAGRMSSVGSIAGFFVGNISLPTLFPWLGQTQLQVLSALAVFILLFTHGVTAYAVEEKVLLPAPKSTSRENHSKTGFMSTLKEIWTNTLTLPTVILQICVIQFLSWIGWFPILFYTTLWVSDIYDRTNASSDGDDSAGTRAGNRALFFSSVVSLVAIIILPLLVSDHKATSGSRREVLEKKQHRWWKLNVATLWAVSNGVFACAMGATLFVNSVWGANLIIAITGFSWAVTQWAPFALLGEAIHTSTPSQKYIRLQGHQTSSSFELERDETPIPLLDRRTRVSLEEQIPLSIEISGADHDQNIPPGSNGTNWHLTHNRENSRPRIHSRPGSMPTTPKPGAASRAEWMSPLPSSLTDDGGGENREFMETRGRDVEWGRADEASDAHDRLLGGTPTNVASRGQSRRDEDDEPASGGIGDKAGIILGIHNVFIVIPQFLVTGLSSIIFAIFEPDRSISEGHHGGTALPVAPVNGTIQANSDGKVAAAVAFRRFVLREDEESSQPSGFDSIGFLFRLGGLSALLAFVVCWRLSKTLRRS